MKANEARDWARLFRLMEFLTIVMINRQRLHVDRIAKLDALGA